MTLACLSVLSCSVYIHAVKREVNATAIDALSLRLAQSSMWNEFSSYSKWSVRVCHFGVQIRTKLFLGEKIYYILQLDCEVNRFGMWESFHIITNQDSREVVTTTKFKANVRHQYLVFGEALQPAWSMVHGVVFVVSALKRLLYKGSWATSAFHCNWRWAGFPEIFCVLQPWLANWNRHSGKAVCIYHLCDRLQ